MDKQPEIGTKTNKDLENDKANEKKGGAVAPFWTSAGGKAASGMAGSGGAGVGGLALGAMFATKTGIITLALVGSTLAGGLGWMGYQNVGREGKGEARFSSLFASKPAPKAVDESSQTGAAGPSGGSSLQFLVDANKNDPSLNDSKVEASAVPAAPTSDAPASNSNSNSNVAVDQTPMTGPASKSPGLNGGKKFGSLSSGLASGSSGAGIRFGSLGGAGEVSNMPKLASSKGIAAPRDSRASLSSRRALSYDRAGSAGRQLAMVRRDHRGATSSSGAGRTYDGGGNTGAIGPEAAAPEGSTGSGDAGASDRKVSPSDASRSEVNEPPPTETGKNVTPWQDALQQGMMLLAGATVLLMIAKKLAEMYRKSLAASAVPGGAAVTAWYMTAAKIVAGLAGAAALAAVYLGSQITFGEYNQPIQGAALMLGGAAMAAAAGMIVFNPDTFSESAYGNIEGLMDICGYVGMAAVAATMLVPKKEYDSSKFKNGEAPDAKIFGYHETAPSEKALERFIA